MKRAAPRWAVEIDARPNAATWTVRRGGRPALTGQAPNAAAAHGEARFVAGALQALERVGRRAF